MQGAALQLMRLNRNVGSREADLGRVILRVLFDGASVKDGLRRAS